jgi:hypothetical protein
MAKNLRLLGENEARSIIREDSVSPSDFEALDCKAARLLSASGVFHQGRDEILALSGFFESYRMSFYGGKDVTSYHKSRVLELRGLKRISSDAVKYLCTPRGGTYEVGQKFMSLDLSGIEVLDSEIATLFAGHKGILYLNGLKTISPLAAEALSRHEGHLILDSLTDLPRTVASHLGTYQGFLISLNSLAYLPPKTASSLVPFDPRIMKLGRDLIEVPEWRRSVFLGHLRLNGLQNLCAETAAVLNRNWGSIQLNGLKNLNTKAVESLILGEKDITLNGLEEINRDALLSLQSSNGGLELNGLSELTENQAEIISEFRCKYLSLNGVKRISEAVARSLARFNGLQLQMLGLNRTNRVLRDFRGQLLTFQTVEEIRQSR